jgi:hypothetical protein
MVGIHFAGCSCGEAVCVNGPWENHMKRVYPVASDPAFLILLDADSEANS